MSQEKRKHKKYKSGYSWGQKVDKLTFYQSVLEFLNGELKSADAAKRCGISKPTWVKWAEKAILGEDIPESFFKPEDNGK